MKVNWFERETVKKKKKGLDNKVKVVPIPPQAYVSIHRYF